MGSQTLEILRQGVWASLTGGYFYDPHQNVFCNAVHLYLWLFLLCTPFVTYLYFPKTFTTWCVYCFTTAFTVTVLKVINMALHILYDKAQTISEANVKKPLKNLKENNVGEDECGIEMQVLGADNPSGVSLDQGNNGTSVANSMLSIDCQEHMTSTIDLKVDVHRKNSSESSDSAVIYSTNTHQDKTSLSQFHSEAYQPGCSRRHSLKVKSKSEERPCKNPSISEEIITQDDKYNIKYLSSIPDHENDYFYVAPSKVNDRKKKIRKRFERQNSFDAAEVAGVSGTSSTTGVDLSLGRSQNSTTTIITTTSSYCNSKDLENFNEYGLAVMGTNVMNGRKSISNGDPSGSNNSDGHRKITGKLQRHKSSDSGECKFKRRGGIKINRHDREPRNDIRNQLQLLASDFYLENSYTKSDFDIENIESDSNKIYILQQPKSMRKHSNSTMSALQLSMTCTNSNNAMMGSNNMKKRRHSNTGGNKPLTTTTSSGTITTSTNVRRIKSAALEISCPQPSVSNLSPHPNSVETITGQQIKNPQSAILPPPSKCLVRNPNFNLYPNSFGNSIIMPSGSLGGTSFATTSNASTVQANSGSTSGEPVYPIVEQIDEKSLNDGFIFCSSTSKSNSKARGGFCCNNNGDDEIDNTRNGGAVGNNDVADVKHKEVNDLYSEIEIIETIEENNPKSRHNRSSTTESESDLERPRTQSTDSETDNNNGSRSPLLNKMNRSSISKCKSMSEETTKSKSKSMDAGTALCIDINSGNMSTSSDNNNKNSSGCLSSDCEQANTNSKDMLISRDKASGNSNNSKGTFKNWSTQDPEPSTSKSTAKSLDIINISHLDEDKYLKNDSSTKNIKENTVMSTKNLGAIPKTIKREEGNNDSMLNKRNLGAIPKSTSRTSSSASSRSYSAESFSNEIYKPYKEHWYGVVSESSGHPHYHQQHLHQLHQQSQQQQLRDQQNQHSLHSQLHQANSIVLPPPPTCMHVKSLTTYPMKSMMDSNFRVQPKSRRASDGANIKSRNSSIMGQPDSDIQHSKLEEISATIGFGSDELQTNGGNTTLSIHGLMNEQYLFENSITSEQRPTSGTILNISHVEFNDAVCCDYWRPCILTTDRGVKPKRFYKYRLQFFGRREIKITMDRLQLLALFDRDLHWFHVIFAIILSFGVCFLGSIILREGFYKDIFAFLFCLVIAGSQYSLLKSVQPDASSPIHGFNKTVAYSRPIYFCLCSGILIFSHHLSKELESDPLWRQQEKDNIRIFGFPFSLEGLLQSLTKIMSIMLLFFPVFFSLGLFPQINTFLMYLLEQIDMHVFGGSAACSLLASILSVLKSVIAVSILYGPAFGGLMEEKGTQHILFSIFCALLIPISYHLSRTASDFTHVWALIKSSLVTLPDDDEEETVKLKRQESVESEMKKEDENESKSELKEVLKTQEKGDYKGLEKSSINKGSIASTTAATGENSSNESSPSTASVDTEPPDPLPKKLQQTVNSRLKNDILVSTALALVVLGLHSTTVFTVLQPDLNSVLYSIAGVLGFLLHYILPQLRKHLPWLCFSRPIFRQQEFGRFEVSKAAKVMWFEVAYVGLCFFERNVLYPLIFISALTADSTLIVKKYGAPLGTAIVSICALKCVRSAYSDLANQYLILIFSVLLFKVDFKFASETFLIDYFMISILYKKFCDFLLKMQFIVTYIAPWQITWGSAFHAFAQPFSVPHSAMLFMQAAISAVLSTPLNPFLGSAIFLTSYARPIKFWERDYNTRRIDHSNTRLSSQLERDLGADDNNLNSIFYEHLTRSLQHSLCGDLLLGRWGQVNQGDCFVLASDYLNCLVHIIELGNGLCTFQMRGLEFRGTYCQQREVEAISEGVEENDGCCCCAPGHLPKMLSVNAMFSTRWLAWQVVAAQYVLEGYSISENLATATLQVFEFRKVLITYYVKSIIYYVTRNNKLDEWLNPGPIQDSLSHTLSRQFVDLDPIFNFNLDEDFDFRALGITRASFCSIYLGWIQFCYAKRDSKNAKENKQDDLKAENTPCGEKSSSPAAAASISIPTTAGAASSSVGDNTNPEDQPKSGSHSETQTNRNDKSNSKYTPKDEENSDSGSIIAKDSPLVSLCLALGLLARRSLATASHRSLSGVEFFLHGLHALFKGDFRITSSRDEWVFADMELLHGVVAPAVKMALKLHQDHFSSPDEYLDPTILYEAITSHSKDLVISHEADPVWRSAVLRGAPNLLALRHVMEDGSDEYRIIRLTKRFLSFRVIKLNRECVRGLWAGQQQELIYLRNRNPERGSIQNAKQALRNIINSSCDQPIGYPIYVSPLTTSYAETNEQLSRIIGGAITLDTIRDKFLNWWKHVRQRCREGCSSGSSGMECDTTNDVPGVYFSSGVANNTTATLSYGSQSLSGGGTRGSLASMNKPTNSALLAGFLNRDRDQDRESIRERPNKKGFQSRSDRERRATLPYTLSAIGGSSRDIYLKDNMGSTNSGLRQLDVSETSHSTKMSTSSGHLGVNDTKLLINDTTKTSNEDTSDLKNGQKSETFDEEFPLSPYPLLELNRKVIIVDGTEIYDCLDLGRRIDVVWPNEKMRSNGGRSSWKDWSPQEGMVGHIVHYWRPNHPDPRHRSNVNRILYLIEIGEHYVPVGENGILEYNQIPDISTYIRSQTMMSFSSNNNNGAVNSNNNNDDSSQNIRKEKWSPDKTLTNIPSIPDDNDEKLSNSEGNVSEEGKIESNLEMCDISNKEISITSAAKERDSIKKLDLQTSTSSEYFLANREISSNTPEQENSRHRNDVIGDVNDENTSDDNSHIDDNVEIDGDNLEKKSESNNPDDVS